MTDNHEKAASRMYSVLLGAVDGLVKNYMADEEKREIQFIVEAKPFDVRFRLNIRPEQEIITLFSHLMFTVPEENRDIFSREICRLNYDDLYVGTFDFDPATGGIVFRMAVIYQDSLISGVLCSAVISYAYETVIKYNEKLFLLSTGRNVSDG